MAVISLVIVFGVLLVLGIWKKITRKSQIPAGLKKLPGPKGYPIIGSVPDVPDELGWIKFSDWGKEFGPIYQCNLAGTNHVWISSDQIAKDLLSKKGAIYSDRPHIPALIEDNRSSGQYLPLMSKNEHWTRQRKFANTIMRESEKNNFHHYPEIESIRLCAELMQDPSQYNHAHESFISRVTCRLAWGHSEASDELKERARELLIGVSPTGSIINKLPFLMSLPDWLSPAKAWERKRSRTERRFFEIMQGQVRSDMLRAHQSPLPSPHKSSWMSLFLGSKDHFSFGHDLEGAYAVGMHGIAGALTIAAVMQGFCLAMCYHPEYLGMLQEELDRVCGERMPTNADKPGLPLLRAVIKETIRWRPPVPTGIPHFLTQDDEYNGYHIPKGSVIHPLEWAISRDPEIYPDPEAFNPLRWIDPSYPTFKGPLTHYPSIINMSQFGYGRRTCQGMTVTEADLIAGIGSIAWLFDISKQTPGEKRHERARSIMMNLKATISNEELVTGMSEHSNDDDDNNDDDDDDDDMDDDDDDVDDDDVDGGKSGGYDGLKIGAFPAPTAAERIEEFEEMRRRESEGSKKVDKQDPTLRFSKLLIAKPTPFRFHMSVRSEKRAQLVQELFAEKVAEGEFPGARTYWGEKSGQPAEFGWVAT
ncbi:cytochrome P450 [Venturia nashicola]|nr:cytochrome P450 [Venturia nashicola]